MRLRALVLAAAILVAGCGGPAEVRSVADFDDHPCALFTDDAMRALVSAPYKDLAGVEVRAAGSPTASGSACVYSYEASGTPQVPQVAAMTVTIARDEAGSQPYSVCRAGATAKAGGYRMINNQACLSPSSDLWFAKGAYFYHVVVLAQPGFGNPIDTSTALSPLIVAVASATNDRLPAD